MRWTILLIAAIAAHGSILCAQEISPPETTARRLTASGPTSPDRAIPGRGRDRFIAVENFARLSEEARRAELIRLYKEISPPIMGFGSTEHLSSISMPADLMTKNDQRLQAEAHDSPWSNQLDQLSNTMTPEAVADAISSVHGDYILGFVARRRCIDQMRKFSDDLAKLIDLDLASENIETVKRALNAIQTVPFPQYTAIVEKMANEPGDVGLAAKAAAGGLRMAKSRADRPAAATTKASK